MIDFSFSDEQKAMQKLARDFAQKEIAPVAQQFDREPAFPGENHSESPCRRPDEPHLPPEYGGQGLGLVDSSIINEELNVACVAIAGMFGINSLGCGPILIGARKSKT